MIQVPVILKLKVGRPVDCNFYPHYSANYLRISRGRGITIWKDGIIPLFFADMTQYIVPKIDVLKCSTIIVCFCQLLSTYDMKKYELYDIPLLVLSHFVYCLCHIMDPSFLE